ncbi:hypothetical protein PR048_006562 [Dryococelus australis]|uniref:Uncharacterized protein n=1 Tax=Dryococelus australis TaxID=614101 RepID=A0ABQ9IC98_9NEOP|nr:hypothetical protein PR048_006562 [Dryococelus australis]
MRRRATSGSCLLLVRKQPAGYPAPRELGQPEHLQHFTSPGARRRPAAHQSSRIDTAEELPTPRSTGDKRSVIAKGSDSGCRFCANKTGYLTSLLHWPDTPETLRPPSPICFSCTSPQNSNWQEFGWVVKELKTLPKLNAVTMSEDPNKIKGLIELVSRGLFLSAESWRKHCKLSKKNKFAMNDLVLCRTNPTSSYWTVLVLLFEGLFRIIKVVFDNCYELADLEGNSVGRFNITVAFLHQLPHVPGYRRGRWSFSRVLMDNIRGSSCRLLYLRIFLSLVFYSVFGGVGGVLILLASALVNSSRVVVRAGHSP